MATKLRRPVTPPKRVRRPQLVQRLNEGFSLGRSLTLVSAPAGFGKTICVSDWVSTLDVPVAWLSLDAEDDDPGRFFTYLIAALQQVNEELGREIGSVLRSGQLPPGEIISTVLINDALAWEDRGVLILDDFQLIQDSFILHVLEKLITQLPRSLHLVLLTREDPPLPLARLRANNQLTEIRASDLRFNQREAEQFLNEVMGLMLSPADIAALDDRTEGWIVGLQLAGFSIRDRANPSGYIATLSGSQCLIQYGRSAASLAVEMSGVSGLALLSLQHGQLHFAFNLATQAIERMERSGTLPPIAAAVHGELGEVCYQWNQIDQARYHFQRAVEVSELSGYSDAEAYFGVVRSRLLQLNAFIMKK